MCSPRSSSRILFSANSCFSVFCTWSNAWYCRSLAGMAFRSPDRSSRIFLSLRGCMLVQSSSFRSPRDNQIVLMLVQTCLKSATSSYKSFRTARVDDGSPSASLALERLLDSVVNCSILLSNLTRIALAFSGARSPATGFSVVHSLITS